MNKDYRSSVYGQGGEKFGTNVCIRAAHACKGGGTPVATNGRPVIGLCHSIRCRIQDGPALDAVAPVEVATRLTALQLVLGQAKSV